MAGFASLHSRTNEDGYIRTNGDNYSHFNTVDHYKSALPYEGQEYAPSVRDWATIASKKRSGNASFVSQDRPGTNGPSLRTQPVTGSIASRKQPGLPSIASEEQSIHTPATTDKEDADTAPITNREQPVVASIAGEKEPVKDPSDAEKQSVDENRSLFVWLPIAYKRPPKGVSFRLRHWEEEVNCTISSYDYEWVPGNGKCINWKHGAKQVSLPYYTYSPWNSHAYTRCNITLFEDKACILPALDILDLRSSDQCRNMNAKGQTARSARMHCETNFLP
ncbi:hypothetical protein LTR95_016426 [Oleoguttula sp. CCFEE 5521]